MPAPRSLPQPPEVLEKIEEHQLVPTATCRVKCVLSEIDPFDLRRDVLQLLGVLRPGGRGKYCDAGRIPLVDEVGSHNPSIAK